MKFHMKLSINLVIKIIVYISPLFFACEIGDIEIIYLLLNHRGIDVNLKYVFFFAN